MKMKQGTEENKSRNKSVILFMFMILTVSAITFFGCKGDPDPDDEPALKITGVSIPSTIDVEAEGDITITGKGFVAGDQIQIVLTTDAGKVYLITVASVTATSVTFTLPAGVTSGTYKITVFRGDDSLYLGSTSINIISGDEIPDIAGMTIKGMVFCNGEGIPGVTVSDGFEVTVTNEDGIYYLASLKKHGYVFISVPGNYEVTRSNNLPQFYKILAGGTAVERKDFSLISTDNIKHVVLTMADMHLANRNDDISQFNSGFLPDINTTISSCIADGAKVYGLTLGDMSWDAYWYENNYGLSDMTTQLNKVNCTVFTTMGNHDNDPYIASDWLAEAKYRSVIGPTYYSFNLGNIHYVVLDDIQYVNTGGSQGTIGDRNYYDVVIANQLAWLAKDLATITDKSAPLVIAMHAQLNSNPTLNASGEQTSNIALNNGSTLLSYLQSFTNVHIVTGHTHVNYAVENSETVMEHNTAAVCATWWWTGKSGYAGNHICTDGSPGGYGIWEMNGTAVKWYYKSIGKSKSYQFRAYDLNKTHITAAAFAPGSTDDLLAPYAGVYAATNTNNEVLINVWGYDPDWTVEVKEAGSPLTVKRVSALDPLHIISYEAMRLNAGATPTESFCTNSTAHMFKTTATSPTSTLDITVTDRFGNVYTQTMTRPKDFSRTMN